MNEFLKNVTQPPHPETKATKTETLYQPCECNIWTEKRSEPSEENLWSPKMSELGIMITMAVCSLVVALDATILVSVLPTLAIDLRGTAVETFWTGTSYLLAHSVLQPFIASLSDIFGRLELLVPSILFFTVGSVICAVAHNFTTMLAGRVVQGVGGAGIITLSQIVFADLVPLRQRPKYFTFVLLAWALGSLLGPLVGGLFVEKATWRWCFYLNLPILGIALPMALFFLRKLQVTGSRESLLSKLKSVDWIGNLLFIASTTWFLIAISWGGIQFAWTGWQTLVPLIFGLAGIILSILYERFLAPSPFLRKELFPTLSATASYIAALFQGLALYMGLYYFCFYFSAAHLFGPIRSGASLFPSTAFMLPGSAVVSALITRLGKFRWAVWAGFAISTLSCGLLNLWDDKTKTAVWAVCLCLFGVGMGMILSSVNFGVQANVSSEHTGRAAAMYAYMRSIGMSIGVAIGGTVFQNVMKRKLQDLAVSDAEDIARNAEGYVRQLKQLPIGEMRTDIMDGYVAGFRGVWITMTALCAAGLVTSLFIKRGDLDKLLVSKFQVQKG